MVYSDNGRAFHIDVAPGEVGKYVLMPGDQRDVRRLPSILMIRYRLQIKREFVTYTGYLDGEKVSVTSTGIGGPSTAIALEELVQCGADTFIRVGTCGGMDLRL